MARINAADACSLSMRQRIDVGELYDKALRALPENIDGQPPLAIAAIYSVTEEELIGDT